MSSVTADCEMLGRVPVQGSADSDSLAALVRQLCKQQQRDRLPGRRCSVICGTSRDIGLEIVPYQRRRPDDEGFESDEDLASLGSYEDPSKRTSQKNGTAATAVAGSDSANSSGVSEDSDDADAASLREQQMSTTSAVTANEAGREVYALSDVAFCHTDAVALPGIAVWVIKTRRSSTAGGSGLEAIVVRARDNKLPDVCRTYQEQSKRYKLEAKPWNGTSGGGNGDAARRKSPAASTAVPAIATRPLSVTEVNRYNLIQRTDTDGVTHIEVTAGPVVALQDASQDLRHRDGQPSSIISMSTPDSPTPADTIVCNEDNDENKPPPQRPERRKYKAKTEDDGGGGGGGRQQQKVVRGQFIRVTVNHCAVPSSPEPERKPAVATDVKASQPYQPPSSTDRLWSTADYDRPDGRYESQRRWSRQGARTRSRSSGPGRRQQHLQIAQPPPASQMYSRYDQPAVASPPTSFGTRFLGKLREITSSSPPPSEQPQPFRRRNSVGESVTANFYQYFNHHHHHHHHQQQPHHFQHRYQQQQVNNGGHLKSVIKKNNKHSHTYQQCNDEPKKVTFSAYATVQVVD
ncbi:uncharacterized protein LOC126844067 [Adelges cooleyi]|uniref:uncharacterized protein LOC126844067 n=1 Tax=Adelges cooleyi TaxID=133065 RepID=UPI002180561C|nr:uncharacterized protein LOC126844067 [Adelges cooleyi]